MESEGDGFVESKLFYYSRELEKVMATAGENYCGDVEKSESVTSQGHSDGAFSGFVRYSI